jgi:hypothetical protein
MRHAFVSAMIVASGCLALAASAQAGTVAGAGPTFPTVVTVGDTGVPASIEVRNDNTPPQNGTANTVCNAGDPLPCPSGDPGITLIPSCGQLGAFSVCAAAGADPGVLQLPATAQGQVGTACALVNFNVTLIDAVFGQLRFTPQPAGSNVVLPNAGTVCRIGFTFTVLKVPNVDQDPATAGAQTVQIVDNTQRNGAITASGRGTSAGMTVLRAQPAIATTASPNVAIGAGSLTDTAVVNGRMSPLPGATIDFRLFGPGDTTCTGAPVFQALGVPYPQAGGPVTSPAFTPATAGTYRWTASYSGDANNLPIAGLCNDANENVDVTKVTPTIATTASPNVAIGAGQLTDTALVSGRVNPVAGATIDFRLYGPNDATCAGAAVFTALNVPYPVAGGPVTSAAFTPATAGTYRWRATYSGDVNNALVAGACNDANENVDVTKVTPTIATTASPNVAVGAGQLTDTAIVGGRVNPVAGATIDFLLYGPNDATCAGAPVFSALNVPYPVAGGPVTSPAFTPTTAGTYRWRATYSGDANNTLVAGACNDANENVDVTKVTPTIATTASAGLALGAGQLTDTAIVSGRVNPVAGATIDFRLYGPNDATCAGAPVFQSLNVPYPVAGGPVTSAAFTPTTVGTYRWRATYSGDVNNTLVAGACNDANENVDVTKATPTIATTASPNMAVGAGTLTDTAIVSGRVNPLAGATIDFRLYGPNDATCAGAPVFQSLNVPYPVAGGPVTSAPFTPATVGAYRWRATYSGDANNALVAGACNDANENVDVRLAAPTIATTASADIAIGGGQLTDTATVSGRSTPLAGATIDFRLYGPDDATCAGTPVFQSLNVPYPVAGGPVTSAAFTPASVGTYRWRATYSGDANNLMVAGACNDANENAVVRKATPTITTTASPNIQLGAGTLTDHATVGGRIDAQPGATITFRLYGPGDATCTGTPVFAPAAVDYPVAGGSVTSAAFTPTQGGTYHWVATYSGDANNALVTGACNDANETTTVTTTPPPPPPPPSATNVTCTPPPGPAPAGGELCVRGTVQISGRTGCQGSPFRVTVSGHQVVRVVFTLDGRRVRVLTKPNSGTRYVLPVNPRKMKTGVHRVIARITFTKSSGTRARTLRVVFSRCVRRAASPSFTG